MVCSLRGGMLRVRGGVFCSRSLIWGRNTVGVRLLEFTWPLSIWAGLCVHVLGPPRNLWFTLGQTEFEFMPRFETSSTSKRERAITFRVINI
jgi:hypothetical protein